MFKKAEFYLYNGLYFDQDMFEKLGLMKRKGFDLMILLQDYEEVYKLENGILSKQTKSNIIDYIGVSDNRDREFSYLIRNNKLIVFPIEIYYGIENKDGILAYFTNKDYRDFVLNQVCCTGFDVEFIDCMTKSQSVINEYNKQQKLIKTYNSLNDIGKSN